MWRSDAVELVAVEVDGRQWALPLAAVERVVATVAIAPLPASPVGVRGAINVGGEAVPVLELELRAGGEPRPVGLDGRIVLARTSTRRVALPVDSVLGVFRVEAGASSAPPRGLPAAPARGAAPPRRVLGPYPPP